MKKETTRKDRWNDEYREKRIRALFPPRLVDILLKESVLTKTISSSFYLHGPTGSGKTVHAANLLINQAEKDFCLRVHSTYLFKTLPNMLIDIKSTYDSKENTEKSILRRYRDIDYLVIDDFGLAKITDWSFQMLYAIINERYEWNKKTVFTSNLDLDSIAELIKDSRITGRIYEMCDKGLGVIEMTDIDYRTQR